MFLMFLVYFLAEKSNYFKSLKNENNPIKMTDATTEITHIKSLMADQCGDNLKVSNPGG